MGEVIGDVLPLAIGIAISPIPIITVILTLLSRHAGKTGAGFLLGWVAGIVVVTVLVLLLVSQAGDASGGKPSTVSSILTLVFGALLLFMALRQWKARPKQGEVGTMPKWTAAIDTFTFGKAARLGLVLSALNPKNLLMCLGAGTTIGAAHLSGGHDLIVVAVFAMLASSSVGIPVVFYLLSREKAEASLIELRGWLTQNGAAVMAVLLLVIGAVLVGNGVGGLSG